MRKGVHIRPVRQKDLRTLARIYCRDYNPTRAGKKRVWTEASALRLMQYWFDRQPDLAFLAEFDGKIVGAFLTGMKPWSDGNHIDDGELFVDPYYQKHGIGNTLFLAICEKAKKKYGATHFEGITFMNKPYLLHWYKKMGFKRDNTFVLIYGDVDALIANLKKIKSRRSVDIEEPSLE